MEIAGPFANACVCDFVGPTLRTNLERGLFSRLWTRNSCYEGCLWGVYGVDYYAAYWTYCEGCRGISGGVGFGYIYYPDTNVE
jgi:hypothetical protein